MESGRPNPRTYDGHPSACPPGWAGSILPRPRRKETMTPVKTWKRARIYAAIGVIGLGVLACVTPPLETPKPTATGITRIYVPQNLKNKVDILFLIDNSNSME